MPDDPHRDDADEPSDERDDTSGSEDASSDDTSDRDADGSIIDGGAGWLSSLLSALEERSRASASGRRRTDRSTLEYDVSIRSIADALEESASRKEARERETGRSPDRQRRKRRRSSSSTNHHLTTRRHDDELLVTADVAGADPDEVTVGFSDSTLVVAVSGRELERIEVPWTHRETEARIRNGVLTVRVEPASHETAGADGEGRRRDTEDRERDDEEGTPDGEEGER